LKKIELNMVGYTLVTLSVSNGPLVSSFLITGGNSNIASSHRGRTNLHTLASLGPVTPVIQDLSIATTIKASMIGQGIS